MLLNELRYKFRSDKYKAPKNFFFAFKKAKDLELIPLFSRKV